MSSSISDLVKKILTKRGITDEEVIERFLNPDYDRDIHDPFLMHDMGRAVERVLLAVERNEKVTVYADYDADGIPGAVVLHDFFKKIGFSNFEVYIPHRHDEGYGLHRDAITQFIESGVQLVITIDLGITAVSEIAYANEHGLDVIVTDHHEPAEILPDAVAIVNPKLGTYPDRMLCGAAVIWKVVVATITAIRHDEALAKKYLGQIPEGWEKWLLDMVGIATLSDMVPLLNENRALAHFGLRVLRQTRRLGLLVLFKKLGLNKKYLVEDDITFLLTPKLNAASRMAHPMDAFLLLATNDPVEAQTMTEHLLKLNTKRKTLVAQIMKEVKHKLADRELGEVIVIGNPDWQLGVLGLVANKIAEEYTKPAFIWSREGEHIKGSCRSDGSCNVVELMTSIADTFVQFGGHKEAGGFTMEPDQIHHFEERLIAALGDGVKRTEAKLVSHDLELGLDDVHVRTCLDIGILAPFGVSHEKPICIFTDIVVEEVRMFGKGQDHIEVSFRNSKGHVVKAIAFYSTPESFEKTPVSQSRVTLYAHIEQSYFLGKSEVRLRIVHIV